MKTLLEIYYTIVNTSITKAKPYNLWSRLIGNTYVYAVVTILSPDLRGLWGI